MIVWRRAISYEYNMFTWGMNTRVGERTVVYRSIVDPVWTTNMEPSVDHRTSSPSSKFDEYGRTRSTKRTRTLSKFRTCTSLTSHKIPHTQCSVLSDAQCDFARGVHGDRIDSPLVALQRAQNSPISGPE